MSEIRLAAGEASVRQSANADRTAAELRDEERYSRQIRFAPIGREGQRKLRASTVLIVGAGALGASLAQHMVRAGVGTVRLVDRDYVEPSNLQRQVLFDEEDARLALPKAPAAAAKLRRVNGGVTVEARVADVTAANAAELAEGAQLVLDGTDNAATRLLMSDVCFRLGIPFLYGGATGASGMSAALLPGETACLRCLIGGEADAEEAESCETAGVISPVVEFVAALQAAEALKLLTGAAEAVRRTWLAVELWPFAVRELRLPGPSAGCPSCGNGAASTKGVGASAADRQAAKRGECGTDADDAAGRDTGARCEAGSTAGHAARFEAVSPGWASAVLCGRDTVQLTTGYPLDADAAASRLAATGCDVMRNPWLVRATTPDGMRLVVFPEGRLLVQGTSDPETAKRVAAAYLTFGPGAQEREEANAR